MGPHLTYQTPDGRFLASISTGLAVNFARWNIATTEALLARGGGTISSWSHHSSGFRVMPGFYLQTSMYARLNEQWLAMLAARYDWAGTLSGGSGPTAFSINLSGWTVMGGLTYTY